MTQYLQCLSILDPNKPKPYTLLNPKTMNLSVDYEEVGTASSKTQILLTDLQTSLIIRVGCWGGRGRAGYNAIKCSTGTIRYGDPISVYSGPSPISHPAKAASALPARSLDEE